MCVTCTGFWMQGVLVWSRAGLNRCEGCPGVSQTRRGSAGATDLCHGTPMDPGHCSHFTQLLMVMVQVYDPDSSLCLCCIQIMGMLSRSVKDTPCV